MWLLLPGDRRRELLHVLESPPFAIGHASMVELFGESGNEPGDARTLLSEDRIARVSDTDAQHRLRELRGLLDDLQQVRANRDFRTFLLCALEDTPFFHGMFAGGGTQRAADDLVGELLSVCDTLERKGDLGLWSFLDELRVALDERSFHKDEDLTAPPNRVRIMTIHQAKGLEFPAVAVAGIKRPRSDSDGFFVSKNRGVFSNRWKDWGRGYKGLEEREHEKGMKEQEERCLLYVAMTRAEDFLFVGSPYAGGVESRGKSLFADVAACVKNGQFEASVIRTAPPVAPAVLPVDVVPAPENDDVDRLLDQWRVGRESLSEQELPPPVSPAPVHFVNWSALATYAACPLQYRYRYILKLGDSDAGDGGRADSPNEGRGDVPDPVLVPKGISPANYGIVVHELLRAWMVCRAGGGVPPPGGDWVEAAMDRLGVARRIVSKVVTGARRMIDAFSQSDLSAPGREMRLEEQFQVRFDRAVFHGVFDRVDRTPDGWRVIDYKIGRESEAYDFQVAFYAWGLRRIVEEDDVTGQLCYLRENAVTARVVDVSRSGVDVQTKALESSLVTGEYAASPGPPCAGCSYAAICRHQK